MSEESSGVTRRDLLRRGGGVALATVWVVPVVQSIGGGTAFAVGSPQPTGVLPTKKGQPDTDVEGTKLPRTGSSVPLTEVAVVGAGLVATGAAVRKLTKSAPVDGPGDDVEGEIPA